MFNTLYIFIIPQNIQFVKPIKKIDNVLDNVFNMVYNNKEVIYIMIYCNLAGLMANKKVNISDVSKATKISRTTLTSLYYNKMSGILFETANELCKYFDVTLDRLFLFSKYDFEISNIDYELCCPDFRKNTGSANINILIKQGNTKRYCDICAIIYFFFYDDLCDIEIDLGYYERDKNIANDNDFLKKFFSSLSDEFKAYFLEMIQNEIVCHYNEFNFLETENREHIPVKCISISSDLWK